MTGVLKYTTDGANWNKLLGGPPGEPGSPGPPGGPGPPGPPGAGGPPTVVQFPVPESVWEIDIGMPCQITIYDSTGRVVEPGTIVTVGTAVTLTFSAPFSGVAYCFA